MYRVEQNAVESARVSSEKALQEYRESGTREAFYRFKEANNAYLTMLRNYYRL